MFEETSAVSFNAMFEETSAVCFNTMCSQFSGDAEGDQRKYLISAIASARFQPGTPQCLSKAVITVASFWLPFKENI
jgi:hypothetical protein